MSARFTRWVVSQWHRPTWRGTLLLLPLSLVFRGLVWLRRLAFRLGLLRVHRLSAPVIVVGNLTVGGSGKTPLVIHLVEALRRQGFRPGVVSRGYGRGERAVQRLETPLEPAAYGDEPVLVALRCGCPVAVGADRVAAARLLLTDCDVIVADDGLQHYRLAREIEIAVIDGEHALGNGRMLPAGPLREPAARLRDVNFVAVRDGEWPGACRYRVAAGEVRRLDADAQTQPLAAWSGRRVHAVAGIGVPERFFGQLEDCGVEVKRHPFPDHHAFTASDLVFGDDAPVLMTEKDAIKCRAFADARMWYVPAVVEDRDGIAQQVLQRLAG